MGRNEWWEQAQKQVLGLFLCTLHAGAAEIWAHGSSNKQLNVIRMAKNCLVARSFGMVAAFKVRTKSVGPDMAAGWG